MKYKNFIKAILTMALFLGCSNISAMAEKEDKSQRKSVIERAAELDAARKTSQTGVMPSTPPAPTRQAPLPPISPTKTGQQKLEELKSSPSALAVKENAAAKAAEDANVRYLPGTKIIVPTLVAPPSVPKPPPQGTSLSPLPKLETSTQPTASEKESEESIKKQTEELKNLGLSDIEVKYIMGMAPKDRDDIVTRYKASISAPQPKNPEAQASKPTVESVATPKLPTPAVEPVATVKSETDSPRKQATLKSPAEELIDIQKELDALNKARTESKNTPKIVGELQIKLISADETISQLTKQIQKDSQIPGKEKQVAENQTRLKQVQDEYDQTKATMDKVQRELIDSTIKERDLKLKSYELSKKLTTQSAKQQLNMVKNLHELISIQENEVNILKQKINTLKTDTVYNLEDKVDALREKLKINPNDENLKGEIEKRESELSAAKTRLENIEKALIPASKLLENSKLEYSKLQLPVLIKENDKKAKILLQNIGKKSKEIAAQEKKAAKLGQANKKLQSKLRSLERQGKNPKLIETKKKSLDTKISALRKKIDSSMENESKEIQKLSDLELEKNKLESTQKELAPTQKYLKGLVATDNK